MNVLGSEEIGYGALEGQGGEPSNVLRKHVPTLYGSRQKASVEKTPLIWVVDRNGVPVVAAGVGDELVEVWAGG